MEEHTGKPIPNNCVVHHINGKKDDNRLENLIIMKHDEHSRLHMSGSGSNTARLSENDVIQIRNRYKNGESQVNLAKEYNITSQNVHLIVNNKTWRCV